MNATHTCTMGSNKEIDFRGESIKISYMFLRPHGVATYLWKWFQILLRPFQTVVKLKFIEKNQSKFYKIM